MHFSGRTYVPERDQKRLTRQYDRVVWAVTRFNKEHEGEWFTLEWLSSVAEAPQASVSARLRDMRKHGWLVENRATRSGLHLYRVTMQ